MSTVVISDIVPIPLRVILNKGGITYAVAEDARIEDRAEDRWICYLPFGRHSGDVT